MRKPSMPASALAKPRFSAIAFDARLRAGFAAHAAPGELFVLALSGGEGPFRRRARSQPSDRRRRGDEARPGIVDQIQL